MLELDFYVSGADVRAGRSHSIRRVTLIPTPRQRPPQPVSAQSTAKIGRTPHELSILVVTAYFYRVRRGPSYGRAVDLTHQVTLMHSYIVVRVGLGGLKLANAAIVNYSSQTLLRDLIAPDFSNTACTASQPFIFRRLRTFNNAIVFQDTHPRLGNYGCTCKAQLRSREVKCDRRASPGRIRGIPISPVVPQNLSVL